MPRTAMMPCPRHQDTAVSTNVTASLALAASTPATPASKGPLDWFTGGIWIDPIACRGAAGEVAGDAAPGGFVMGQIGLLALRGLAGGTLVVIFALIGEAVSPKAFSGLFSAAPSVSIASLIVIVLTEGTAAARLASTGMVVGGLAMIACCILAAATIPRIRSVRGSLAAWLGWLAADLGLYWAVFIGAH